MYRQQISEISKSINNYQKFSPIVINNILDIPLIESEFKKYNIEGYWLDEEFLLPNYLFEICDIKSLKLAVLQK